MKSPIEFIEFDSELPNPYVLNKYIFNIQTTVELVTRLLFPHVKYIQEKCRIVYCTKDEYLYRIGISRGDVNF